MRILFVAGTLAKGGAERQLFYLCRLLKQEHHEVKVLSFTLGEYYEQEITNLGIEIEHITPSKNKFLKLFDIYKQTIKFMPDVLYGFHFYTGIYVGVIGRITSVLSIGSIRSNGLAEKKANGLISWLHYSFPKLIIANSENAIENVLRVFYKKEVTYLPNIIDLNYFTFREKEKSNKLNLLFIGSLKQVKQPILFIEIVDKLVNNGIEVSAEIIGNGPMEKLLKSKSEGLPVSFLGELDDVRQNLYHADYLISTSKLEGTPNVMLEAFACGTPVLALEHSGLKIWIKLDLVQVGNTIDEMVSILLKNKNHNAIKPRLFLEKEHSEKVVLKRLNDIFA